MPIIKCHTPIICHFEKYRCDLSFIVNTIDIYKFKFNLTFRQIRFLNNFCKYTISKKLNLE